MYITPAFEWYMDRVLWLRFENLQLVAGTDLLTGEDGGFFHRPHASKPWPLDPLVTI
jgi:hypothetical protein